MNDEVPFTIETDIFLGDRVSPYLRMSGADVRICEGRVPERLHDEGWLEGVYQRSETTVLFALSGGPRILVENGQRVTYAREGASERDLVLYLLGTAFAIICYQRYFLPLHASAVVVSNHICAFAGKSGAGKSTLAAALSNRGYPFLTDDVLITDPSSDGFGIKCYSGPKDLKLLADALEFTGACAGSTVSDRLAHTKFYATPGLTSDWTSGSLRSLYVIEKFEGAGLAEVSRITGASCVPALLPSIYRIELAQLINGRNWLFKNLVLLAEQLVVQRFARTLAPGCFDKSLSFLEQRLDACHLSE